MNHFVRSQRSSFIVAVLIFLFHNGWAQTGKLGLQGRDPYADIPEITGPFQITVTLYIHTEDDSGDDVNIFEFKDTHGGNYLRLRRDGSDHDKLQFECTGCGGESGEQEDDTPSDFLVVGTEITVQAGIDTNGYMFIKKNGVVAITLEFGWPSVVSRPFKKLAFEIGNHDIGLSLLGFRLEHFGQQRPILDSLRYLSFVGQPYDHFEVTFFAHFKHVPSVEQTIFEFGNPDSRIWVGVLDDASIRLELFQDGNPYSLSTSSGACTWWDMELWSAGMDPLGNYFIS